MYFFIRVNIREHDTKRIPNWTLLKKAKMIVAVKLSVDDPDVVQCTPGSASQRPLVNLI